MSTEPIEEQDRTHAAAECFCQEAAAAFTKFAKTFGPPEAACNHFRQARIEVLKGLRELIDARIESLGKPVEPKGTKIVVE